MFKSIVELPPILRKARKLVFKLGALVLFVYLSSCCSFAQPPGVEDRAQLTASSLGMLAADFWQWRARYQPFSSDDIPCIDHIPGRRDWSPVSHARQRAALNDFEKRWKDISTNGWSIPEQVDYRLMGSALARVRWELDINQRWLRDPSFYIEQTLTALAEALVQPPPLLPLILLQRWEYLGRDDDLRTVDLLPPAPPPTQ
jgi:hypothetical protein